MTNSKSSSTGNRAAKSSGGSNKSSSNRQGSNGTHHTKQTSQRSASSSAPPKVQPKTQAKSDKVAFSGSAKKQLDSLGLNEKQHREVERWHERTVRREMNHIGADHAKIRFLAHADGSNDSKPHITASLKTKDGDTIKNGHGNLSHLYYNEGRLPPVYRGAVQRKESSS